MSVVISTLPVASASTTDPKATKTVSAGAKTTYIRNAAGEFVCPHCGVTKARQNTMYYHMKKHTGEMSHFCGVCSKGFIQKSGLDQHMLQAHPTEAAAAGADVSLYACPCCDHSSKMKANLVIHIARKHGGGWIPDVPTSGGSTCSGCDRCFSSPTAYYYHAATCFSAKAPATIAEFLKSAVGAPVLVSKST
jgi:hypothetical protein